MKSLVNSSHAVTDTIKDDLIQRTLDVWQPRLGRDLSREEAKQIADNLTGFFTLLAEWSRAELLSPANDIGTPDAAENGEASADSSGVARAVPR